MITTAVMTRTAADALGSVNRRDVALTHLLRGEEEIQNP
jgi:hypothetical protein